MGALPPPSSQSGPTVSPQEGTVAGVSRPLPCVAEVVFQSYTAKKTKFPFRRPAPTCRVETLLQEQQDKNTRPWSPFPQPTPRAEAAKPFHQKTINKLGIEENSLNLIKDQLQLVFRDNIPTNSETQNAFPLKSGKRWNVQSHTFYSIQYLQS